MSTVVDIEAPSGSFLIRIAVDPDVPWRQQLPALPSGLATTVTLGSAELNRLPDGATTGGYRVAGIGGNTPPGHLDVFVTPELRRAGPTWWEALLSHAERVYDLRMGPVRRLLAGELALHLRALR